MKWSYRLLWHQFFVRWSRQLFEPLSLSFTLTHSVVLALSHLLILSLALVNSVFGYVADSLWLIRSLAAASSLTDSRMCLLLKARCEASSTSNITQRGHMNRAYLWHFTHKNTENNFCYFFPFVPKRLNSQIDEVKRLLNWLIDSLFSPIISLSIFALFSLTSFDSPQPTFFALFLPTFFSPRFDFALFLPT